MVEYDAGLAARARETADALTATVEIRQADAAQSDVNAHAVPADLVSLCGIFGNSSDADVRATVEAAPQLCAPRAEWCGPATVTTQISRRPSEAGSAHTADSEDPTSGLSDSNEDAPTRVDGFDAHL